MLVLRYGPEGDDAPVAMGALHGAALKAQTARDKGARRSWS